MYAYLVVAWDHGGDVADGEGLTGQQAQGHRRAHTGVSAGEHHVLHAAEEENHHQVGKKREHARKTCPVPMVLIDKQVGRSARSVEDYTQNQKAATFEF